MYINFYHVSTISQNYHGGQQSNLEQDQTSFSPSLSNLGPGYFPNPKLFCFFFFFPVFVFPKELISSSIHWLGVDTSPDY